MRYRTLYNIFLILLRYEIVIFMKVATLATRTAELFLIEWYFISLFHTRLEIDNILFINLDR